MSMDFNNPSHYKLEDGTDSMDWLRKILDKQAFRGFLEGNIQKYLIRYKKKNGLDDLKKARDYLNRLIKDIEVEEVRKIREEELDEILEDKTKKKDDYVLLGYHKEKPRYYAKIKGWEILGNGICYFYQSNDKNIYLTSGKYAKHLTKTEWADLGITDENADLLEVEECKNWLEW